MATFGRVQAAAADVDEVDCDDLIWIRCRDRLVDLMSDWLLNLVKGLGSDELCDMRPLDASVSFDHQLVESVHSSPHPHHRVVIQLLQGWNDLRRIDDLLASIFDKQLALGGVHGEVPCTAVEGCWRICWP